MSQYKKGLLTNILPFEGFPLRGLKTVTEIRLTSLIPLDMLSDDFELSIMINNQIPETLSFEFDVPIQKVLEKVQRIQFTLTSKIKKINAWGVEVTFQVS